MKRLRN